MNNLINYYFLKFASRILFIEIVNTLKNTKKSPNQPKITAIDNKLEPKSRCSKSCIKFLQLYRSNFTLYNYLSKMKMFKIQIVFNFFIGLFIRCDF